MRLYDIRLALVEKLLELREHSRVESPSLLNDVNLQIRFPGSVNEGIRRSRRSLGSPHEGENANVHQMPVFLTEPDQVFGGPRNSGGLHQRGDADRVSWHFSGVLTEPRVEHQQVPQLARHGVPGQ